MQPLSALVLLGCVASASLALKGDVRHAGLASKAQRSERPWRPRMLRAQVDEALETRPVCSFFTVPVAASKPGPPAQEISVEDLTPKIHELLAETGMRSGVVNVISLHTTTAITINEWESRLAEDIKTWLVKLAPPDDRSSIGVPGAGVSYEHNDIDQRPASEAEWQRCKENGWDVDDPGQLAAWRAQEPINAHAHLLSMTLGSSESIPVVDGMPVLGQWQSVMMVDVDGPRDRKVGIQLMGTIG